jgi:integrase
MAWHKRNGAYDVYVYDPQVKRKRYVGRRELERDARVLFREKTDEFANHKRPAPKGSLTIREYATDWLRDNHGEGTTRPARATLQVNRTNLTPFLEEFGDRDIDGGIGRRQALAWSKKHGHNAKSVSAMFNDAIDEEVCKTNPFANRKQDHSRERKDIHPLTETEVDRLADIALRHWGEDGYGLTARAMVLFGAWVGCRPGEMQRVELRHLNFAEGTAKIKRVKKRGKVYPTDTVVFPKAAQDAIRAMPEIPREGPIFLSVSGRPMVKGNLVHHWGPIRAAFRETVTPERWEELTEGKRDLDYYALRHYVASIMADRGADARDIAAQLGNSVQVCEETYIHGYRDRQLNRNRLVLERPVIVDLDARRKGA